MVQSIKTKSEYDEILAKHSAVLIKFSAEWCGPCKQVAPIINELAPKFPNVFIGDVDVDQNSEVAQINEVTAMPTFVFFKNGKEIHRIRGGNIPQIIEQLKSLEGSA